MTKAFRRKNCLRHHSNVGAKVYRSAPTFVKACMLVYLLAATTTSIVQPSRAASVDYWLEVIDPTTGTNLVEFGPNPPTVVDQEFTVMIEMKKLSETLNLTRVSYTLNYNSTLFEAVGAMEGGFLKAGDPNQNQTFTADWTTYIGQITIAQAQEEPRTRFPAGNGTLASVTFKIIYQGQYPTVDENLLTLTDITLIGLNPDTDQEYSIPVDTTKTKDCLVRIKGLAQPTISLVSSDTGKSDLTFYTNTTPLGSLFEVTVWVSDVTDLFAWQVHLAYNASQLAWIKTETGEMIPYKDDPAYVFYGKPHFPVVTNTTDSLTLGDLILAEEPQTFDGTGKLCVIKFKILEAPAIKGNVSSILSINSTDTFIFDSSNSEIPVVKADGRYAYVWAEILPSLEIKPAEYVAVESETFNMTLWLNNIKTDKKLTSLEFKLHFNKTLLEPVQAFEGSFLKAFGFTFDYYFNVDNVEIQYYLNPPYSNFPDGSGPIVSVTFRGIYQDSKDNNSTLEIVDIKLKDENQTEVSYGSPKNGLYTILSFGSSIITISVHPTSVTVGSDVAIAGTLKPRRDNANITIYYRLVGESWKNLTLALTDSHSNYTFIWTTTETGSYELKANWTGDASTNPAESDIRTVTVEPKTVPLNITPYILVGTAITVVATIAIAMLLIKTRKH